MNPPGSIKRFVFSMLAFFFSLLICLVLLEGGLRITYFSRVPETQYADFVADPFLPYKPRPGSELSGRSASGEYDFHYRHDAFGLRAGDCPAGDSGEPFTILVLGDSFTYGVGAAIEDTYPFQLERMLNERPGGDCRVEVVNAGIPRYFPEAERIFLEHYGERWSPRLVLVGFLPNDVYDTALGMDAIALHDSGYLLSREAAKIGKPGIWLGRHSRLFRLALEAWVAWRRSRESLPRWREIFRENGFHERDWRKVEDEYRKMITICRDRGIGIVFIHIPQKGPWDASHDYPAKRLAAFARENGAGFVDVLPAMRREAGSKKLYHEKDGHCNAEGYRVIAETISRYLDENGLVP